MNGTGRIALALALFVSSAAGLVLEIVAARLIAPYVGMSVYTWTAIIATVLAGMSAGHWIGGRLAEVHDRRALGLTAAAFAAAALNVLVIPVLLRATAPGLLGEGNVVAAVTGLSAVLFLVPSLLIALPSPILTRLAIDAEPDRRGVVIGRMFALGAGGAILGTLAAGFLFISWIGSQGTLLAVALTLGLLAAGFALWALKTKVAQAALAMVALGTAAGVMWTDDLTANVCDAESRYYCIRVIDFAGETGRESKLMVLDHMGHGINDREDPELIHSSYVEMTDSMVRLRFPGRDDIQAFFMGGGAYTLPRAWAERYPKGRHLVAEIDPKVTDLARDLMWFEPKSSIEIRHVDARVALATMPDDAFDVVVGDAFHDFSAPQHLVTKEFAALLRRVLNEDGLYVMTTIDAAKEPRFLLAMLKTLYQVFPAVEIWADGQQLAGGGRLTYLLVASDRPLALPAMRSLRFEDRRWYRVDPAQVAGDLSPDDLPVMTDDYAPVDRLMGAVLGTER